ncbi:Nogo-B receptor [Trichinella nelsoni]|uniref:ditrans,polycis-polyprenyl diphosphate synthase [(2E,6E)-farnesyldiphosphate specific] n=1 Tax=Trichinella nelsoni TaxID=6336 RepID=A0A0V0RJ91_9BILA|nr:Nogo-B receptor [Trichinella nelsoni]KRX14496.1 Nogo-B receptor [Trichinella nelsoni]
MKYKLHNYYTYHRLKLAELSNPSNSSVKNDLRIIFPYSVEFSYKLQLSKFRDYVEITPAVAQLGTHNGECIGKVKRLFKNVSDIALLWLLIVLRFCFEQWIRIENGISYYYNKLKRCFIEKVPSSFKLPSHLGFVLIHEEDNDTDRLVLLVSKCAMLGICHVTLYRMRLWNSTERYKLIYQVKKKLNYCTKSQWLLQDSMGKFTLYNENGQRFCCSILDIRSGRFSIVQALKEYSHKQACCEEVTFDERQFVETFLDGQHCLEDVDYLLFFGGVVTVAGFPPLSLRWTEFGALPPLKDVQERHLLESLHIFALKEQRFGK